jgi:hypothetical protein
MIERLVLNGVWLGLWGAHGTYETALQGWDEGQDDGLP